MGIFLVAGYCYDVLFGIPFFGEVDLDIMVGPDFRDDRASPTDYLRMELWFYLWFEQILKS